MQQLVRIDQRTSPGQATSLPSSRVALLALLDEARELAREGDLQAARLVCAEAMFRFQPLLTEDVSLLAAMIASMVHARGFHMVSRLMAAIDGRQVRFISDSECGSGTVASRTDDDGIIHVSVSETCLAQEAAIARWSAELAGLAQLKSSRSAA